MNDTASATRVLYESTVTGVGGQVEAFLDHGMLIFFGADAPKELHEMSVQHRATVAEEGGGHQRRRHGNSSARGLSAL